MTVAKLQDVQRQRDKRERQAEARAENDRRAAAHVEPGRQFTTGTSAAHTKEGTA